MDVLFVLTLNLFFKFQKKKKIFFFFFPILISFAGEPGKLIRERYRTASQVVQNQVRSFITFTVNICMSCL